MLKPYSNELCECIKKRDRHTERQTESERNKGSPRGIFVKCVKIPWMNGIDVSSIWPHGMDDTVWAY